MADKPKATQRRGRQVNLRLNDAQSEMLQKHADRLGLELPQVIRIAISEFLEKRATSQPQHPQPGRR